MGSIISRVTEKEDLLEQVYSYFTPKELLLNYNRVNRISNRVANTILATQYIDVKGDRSPIYDTKQVIQKIQQRIRALSEKETLHIRVIPFLRPQSVLVNDITHLSSLVFYYLKNMDIDVLPQNSFLDLRLDDVAKSLSKSPQNKFKTCEGTAEHFGSLTIERPQINNLYSDFHQIELGIKIAWQKKLAAI